MELRIWKSVDPDGTSERKEIDEAVSKIDKLPYIYGHKHEDPVNVDTGTTHHLQEISRREYHNWKGSSIVDANASNEWKSVSDLIEPVSRAVGDTMSVYDIKGKIEDNPDYEVEMEKVGRRGYEYAYRKKSMGKSIYDGFRMPKIGIMVDRSV